MPNNNSIIFTKFYKELKNVLPKGEFFIESGFYVKSKRNSSRQGRDLYYRYVKVGYLEDIEKDIDEIKLYGLVPYKIKNFPIKALNLAEKKEHIFVHNVNEVKLSTMYDETLPEDLWDLKTGLFFTTSTGGKKIYYQKRQLFVHQVDAVFKSSRAYNEIIEKLEKLPTYDNSGCHVSSRSGNRVYLGKELLLEYYK